MIFATNLINSNGTRFVTSKHSLVLATRLLDETTASKTVFFSKTRETKMYKRSFTKKCSFFVLVIEFAKCSFTVSSSVLSLVWGIHNKH